MSLEFAEKVRGIREGLGLNQYEFADLLDVTRPHVSMWESLAIEETSCWERIIQFLIDCPSSALQFLREKPWVDEGKAWPDRIMNLLKVLNWRAVDLVEFLEIYETSFQDWISGRKIDTCYQITMSLLEVYSSVDPKEWPAALHVETPDVITRERIRLLRLSLGKTQAQFGDLLHVANSTISGWENGHDTPVWSANLLLRMLETWPRSVDLLEKIPWDDTIITPEAAFRTRESLGLTGLELARLLGTSAATIYNKNEKKGLAGKNRGPAILVYRLLQEYQDEFLSYVQGLSSPGGQACPIW